MMDGISELAKLFKERENKPTMGIQIGKVLSPLPDIKIGFGDRIILDKDNLIISDLIYNKTLENNDEVILIPASDNQTYYAIDKVVRV